MERSGYDTVAAMNRIIRFQSEDGSIFDSEELCKEYETLCAEVAKEVSETIGFRPPTLVFENGGGYVQHSKENVQRLKNSLYRWVARFHDFKNDSFLFTGRYLSDGDSPADKLLYKVWVRLDSIDVSFREWGQPYYAHTPGTGSLKEIKA